MSGASRNDLIEELIESWTDEEVVKIVKAVREHLKHQAAASSAAALDRLLDSVAEKRRREIMDEVKDEDQPAPALIRIRAEYCLADAVRRARARLP